MGLELATFPTLPAFRQTVTLEGTQFRARLTWRERCQAWYLDVWTLDGTALALGRRLSAGWSPLFGLTIENAPDGLFLVRGEDAYIREDLGVNVRLLYYTRDELRAASTSTTDRFPLVDLA